MDANAKLRLDQGLDRASARSARSAARANLSTPVGKRDRGEPVDQEASGLASGSTATGKKQKSTLPHLVFVVNAEAPRYAASGPRLVDIGPSEPPYAVPNALAAEGAPTVGSPLSGGAPPVAEEAPPATEDAAPAAEDAAPAAEEAAETPAAEEPAPDAVPEQLVDPTDPTVDRLRALYAQPPAEKNRSLPGDIPTDMLLDQDQYATAEPAVPIRAAPAVRIQDRDIEPSNRTMRSNKLGHEISNKFCLRR